MFEILAFSSTSYSLFDMDHDNGVRARKYISPIWCVSVLNGNFNFCSPPRHRRSEVTWAFFSLFLVLCTFGVIINAAAVVYWRKWWLTKHVGVYPSRQLRQSFCGAVNYYYSHWMSCEMKHRRRNIKRESIKQSVRNKKMSKVCDDTWESREQYGMKLTVSTWELVIMRVQ